MMTKLSNAYESPNVSMLDEAVEGVYMASGASAKATIASIGPMVMNGSPWESNGVQIANFNAEIDFTGITDSPSYMTVVFNTEPRGVSSSNGGVTSLGGQAYRFELWNRPTSITMWCQGPVDLAIASALLD